MKRPLYVTLFLLACSALFLTCQKDSAPKTVTELLTNGSQKAWRVIAFTANPGIDIDITGMGILTTDIFATYKACNKDNLYIFKSDKSYTAEEGATKCNSNDPQIYLKSTWQLNNDETIIVIGNQNDLSIVSITENELIVTQSIKYGSPRPYVGIYTTTFVPN